MAAAESEVREWMAQLERYLGRFRTHHQFEEILAEGYKGIAEALARPVPDNRQLSSIVLQAGYRRALDFFRSLQNESRRYTRRGVPSPDILRLADLEEDKGRWYPVEPDFAPALIEYLAAREKWERLPAVKREAIQMVCEGYTRNEIIAALGLSWRGYWRLLATGQQARPAPRKSAALRRRTFPNSTGFRGVHPCRELAYPRFRCQITVRGVITSLATWPTAEEAALVYDAAVLYYLDGDGHLNLLPDEYRQKEEEGIRTP